ncbi:hypothetical protein H0N96_03150, partial [Candidatus Micrarchaeota archaeon]|nr:hypothetical protein [Candidatus Micrarchaeota archaeon]
MVGYGEKTVAEVFRELAVSGASFKFAARGGSVKVSIDGLHSSLSPR